VPGVSVSVELTFRWPMGHRILGLDGPGAKCRNIHGHNWIAEVSLPNDNGVLEFGEVKALIGGWIEHNWDHGFMCEANDPFKRYLVAEGLKFAAINEPPTTEAIATLLAEVTSRLIGVMPRSVHVTEGFNNAATWKDDNAWP
jgi:6-pyruvoyltetrahydropterin/6-carboxytetrahydropterin synthase